MATDRLLNVATAPSTNSARWTQREPAPWADVLDWLDLPNPADRRECGGYVGGLLRDGTRKRTHVESRSLLTLDADKAGPNFVADVRRLLPGVAAALHTTWRHGVAGVRYRLLAPLSRDVTAEEYERLACAVRDALGDHWGADKGCPEPERFLYRPATQNRSYESHVIEGGPLSVEAWLPAVEVEHVPPAVPHDPYAAKRVEDELARLDECAALGWAGPPWDCTHFAVACNLIEIGNSDWSGFDLDDLKRVFLDRAATDEGFGPHRHEAKWASAVTKVAGGGVPRRFTPAEDFAAPWLASANAANAATADVKFQRDVEREVTRLRVQQAAREALARSRLEATPVVRPTELASFLAEPDEAARFRVEGLLPTHGRVVFSAQFKAGKTTLMGNLARCLADGDRFLDSFEVEQAQRVVLLDNELSRNTVRLWLRDQGIVNVGAVAVLPLRGQLSGFNILDPVVRSEWAQAIGPADVLVFDCLRPALDVLGLSEDKDAGRFLGALDELCAEAGVKELVVVHHMGHSGERSRGDSRILDWPDAVWKLVMEDPARPDSSRYFAAHGRDVFQPESQLAYNADDRHLSLVGGSRKQAKASTLEVDVLDHVGANPGCGKNELEDALGGDRNAVREAARGLLAARQLRMEKGGKKHCLYVVEPGSEFAREE